MPAHLDFPCHLPQRFLAGCKLLCWDPGLLPPTPPNLEEGTDFELWEQFDPLPERLVPGQQGSVVETPVLPAS